jgi:hypothetical protein
LWHEKALDALPEAVVQYKQELPLWYGGLLHNFHETEPSVIKDLAVLFLSRLLAFLAFQQKIDLNGYQRDFQRQLKNFKHVSHSTTSLQHGNADRYGGTVRQTATLKWYYIPIAHCHQRLSGSLLTIWGASAVFSCTKKRLTPCPVLSYNRRKSCRFGTADAPLLTIEAETANHQDVAVSALSRLLAFLAFQQKIDLNGY